MPLRRGADLYFRWVASIPSFEIVFIAMNVPVERVSFNRRPTCFRNELANLFDRQNLGCRCTRIVIYQFVAPRTIDIVCTVRQRCLGGADS